MSRKPKGHNDVWSDLAGAPYHSFSNHRNDPSKGGSTSSSWGGQTAPATGDKSRLLGTPKGDEDNLTSSAVTWTPLAAADSPPPETEKRWQAAKSRATPLLSPRRANEPAREKTRNHVLRIREDLTDEEYRTLFMGHGGAKFVLPCGKLNIVNRYASGAFYRQDRFHTLLELTDRLLGFFIFCLYVTWAAAHALVLALLTEFDYVVALGEGCTTVLDYYFFVIETMFAIGFGTPRYPACTASNCYVTVIIVSTTVLNGVVLGVIFAKFSQSASRRFMVKFSSGLCAAIIHLSPVIPPTPSTEQPSPTIPLIELSIPPESDPLEEDAVAFAPRQSSAPLVSSMTHRAEQSKDDDDERFDLISGRAIPRAASGSALVDSAASVSTERADGELSPPTTMSARTRGKSHNVPLSSNQQSIFNNAYTAQGGGGRNRLNLISLFGCTTARRRSSHGKTILLADSFGNIGEDATEQRPTKAWKHYTLSFRVKNITSQYFFDSTLSVYLLHHSPRGLVISEFPNFYTDIPLQFMQMPITVTVDSVLPDSPLHSIAPEHLIENGCYYDLLILLSFTDNCTATPVEIRYSWRLDQISWGSQFKNIVGRLGRESRGAYEIDVDAMSDVEPLEDEANAQFVEQVLRI